MQITIENDVCIFGYNFQNSTLQNPAAPQPTLNLGLMPLASLTNLKVGDRGSIHTPLIKGNTEKGMHVNAWLVLVYVQCQ